MRLRRRDKPAELSDAFVETVAAFWLAIEQNLKRCRRLAEHKEDGRLSDEQRDDALTGARDIAYLARVIFESLVYTVDSDAGSEQFLPAGVHGAAARLAYALASFAEDDPESEQLLSAEEVDAVPAQYEIQAWLDMCRKQATERGIEY
jgi:hypothetical protein